MKVNCLGCGHNLDCDDAYGDYQGPLKCFACGTILEIKTEAGKLHSVNFAKAEAAPAVHEVVEQR